MAEKRTVQCRCGSTFEVDVPECRDADVLAVWGQMITGAACDNCADEARERRERIEREQAWRICVEQTRIPENFRHYDKNLGNTALIEWMRTHYMRSMYISGDYGIGKTRAVCYAGIKLAKAGKSVLYLPAADYARSVARQWRDDGEDPVAEAINADVVILDDLGKEKTTPRTAEALNSLVDARYRESKPIWVTTNYRLTIIADRMGEIGNSIARRLRYMCMDWDGETKHEGGV